MSFEPFLRTFSDGDFTQAIRGRVFGSISHGIVLDSFAHAANPSPRQPLMNLLALSVWEKISAVEEIPAIAVRRPQS